MHRIRRAAILVTLVAMATLGGAGAAVAQDTTGGCQHCHHVKDQPLDPPPPRREPTDEERTGGQGGDNLDPDCDVATQQCPTSFLPIDGAPPWLRS